jgi:hypothetical protein
MTGRMRAALLAAVLIGCGNAGTHVPPDGTPVLLDALPDGAPPDAASPDARTSPGVALADVVTAAPGASGTGFGDPHNAVNGVRGGGKTTGSLDVYSLGYGPGGNESITLAWSAGALHNGPGADLAVFENPFVESGGGVFMDQIIVEVSRDAITWREIAHHYAAADETVYSNDPTLWQGFGGVTPVLFNCDTNVVDPFHPVAAGGDELDLDNVVGTDAEAAAIRTNGASYVRLVAAPARTNPDTGAPYVHDPLANGPDIDGVYGRYVGP